MIRIIICSGRLFLYAIQCFFFFPWIDFFLFLFSPLAHLYLFFYKMVFVQNFWDTCLLGQFSLFAPEKCCCHCFKKKQTNKMKGEGECALWWDGQRRILSCSIFVVFQLVFSNFRSVLLNNVNFISTFTLLLLLLFLFPPLSLTWN